MNIFVCKELKQVMAICLLLCLVTYSSAQPGSRKNHNEQLETIQGNITDWEANNDWIYHAFILKSNQRENILVKFPPHLGSDIQALGEHDLKVSGYLRTDKEGKRFLHLLSISNGDSEVNRNIGDRKKGRPHKKEPISVKSSGKIEKILYNDNRIPTAYLLNNGTILKMPPHIFNQLNNIVKIGTDIEYEGLERRINRGELQSDKKIVVHARAIEINGTRYFIK